MLQRPQAVVNRRAERRIQLTPQGIHRRNTAERAIRTAKNHLIAGLCTINPKFPLYLWDKLLPQAELTMNMLRGSRMNTKLSAWDQVCGVYDYNSTPIGPPAGTRVLVHEKPNQRDTWALHGKDAWYIGPSFEHNRCYKVWAWETRPERDTDMLSWFPHSVRMPTPSAIDRISAVINDIAAALKSPTPESPLAPLTTSQAAALQDLLSLLTPTSSNNEPDTSTLTSTSTDVAPPIDADATHAPPRRVESVPEGDAAVPLTYRDATKRKPRAQPRQRLTPPGTVTPKHRTGRDQSDYKRPRKQHDNTSNSTTT